MAPEIKKKAAEAKSRGDEAFKRKDFQTAIDAYTQVSCKVLSTPLMSVLVNVAFSDIKFSKIFLLNVRTSCMLHFGELNCLLYILLCVLRCK